MFVVGLTGGIGTGKSVVAKLFAENGVPIIDADVIAREMTEPNSPAYHAIVKHFENSILLPDKTLNRPKLRQIIFTDTNQRIWLENLLHPLIRKKMEQQIKNMSEPYCIAVIPLLFEVEFYFFINRTLVVDAPEKIQIDRIMARDNISKPQIKAILKAQANREQRLARAQDIIINDKDPEDLVPQVKLLHKKYLSLGAATPK